jgi:DNA-binding transcriptional MerR regulator
LRRSPACTLRTVRYYVQEELIDRPLARGPGAHFTDLHLRQLKRCKLLQDWGFDLETIRDKAGSFQSILDGFSIDANYFRDGAAIRSIFQALGHEPGSGAMTPKQAEAVKVRRAEDAGKINKTRAGDEIREGSNSDGGRYRPRGRYRRLRYPLAQGAGRYRPAGAQGVRSAQEG